MRRNTKGTLVVAALCALLSSAPARADNEAGTAAAESLFQEGRKLAEAKRYSEACPKFAASQKLAPAIGTLLNLADCYEKNNQLASAWARFHEAIALARRLNRPNREQTARERAARLEPRLIRLSILSRASGLEVKLDGHVIDPAALGTPIPVDAGKHTIEATAKGKQPYVSTFEASQKDLSPTVEIPPLKDESEPSPPAPGVTAPPETEPATEPTPTEKHEPPFTAPPKEEIKTSRWSTQKTIAVITAGVGVVGLGVGGWYGFRARTAWNDAQPYCNQQYKCEQDGVNLGRKAQRFGNFSTIGFIAGGVLLAGGAVLYFTAPKPKTAAGVTLQRVGLGPGSLELGGTF